MSFLDLYEGDQAVALKPQPNEGARLPTTFSEGLDVAYRQGELFSSTMARENARMEAISDYVGEINKKAGKNVGASFDYGTGEVPLSSQSLLPQVNDAAQKAGMPALSDDDLTERALSKSKAARTAYSEFAARESTFAGSAGAFVGSLGSAVTDPVNIVAMPIAPGAEMGILAQAIRFGLIAGTSQAAIELLGSPYRERVDPEYAPTEALGNIGGAAAGGAALGGGFKALGNVWTRIKTGAWPRSIRDAGNIVESEANISNSNVFSGVDGNAAHQQALAKSIDDILNGRPVDVSHIITPEIEASSRGILVRLEAEAAERMPAFDRRAVELLSEEAGLRNRDLDLSRQLDTLPQGDQTAADRLNRLQAVEQQIANTTDKDALRKLNARRDQILVDTTPGQLFAAAEPIERARAFNTEREAIAARLKDIADERAKNRADNLSELPKANIGQREPIRPAPSMEDLRKLAAASKGLADVSKAWELAGPAPELPFKLNASQAEAEASMNALSAGVRQIAERGGYQMSKEEADRAAAALMRLSPDQAQDALRDIQLHPTQAARMIEQRTLMPGEVPLGPKVGVVEQPWLNDAMHAEMQPDNIEKTLAAPEHQTAVRSGLDQLRMTQDVQVHVGVNDEGKPIVQSLDSMLKQIDDDRAAAELLEGCINPVKEAAE